MIKIRPLKATLAEFKKSSKIKSFYSYNWKKWLFNKIKNEIIEIPAFTNTVVDTIGAGDAFFVISSLFAYLKSSPTDIGFIGNVSGALKVNILGHSSSIKKSQLLKFIESVIK